MAPPPALNACVQVVEKPIDPHLLSCIRQPAAIWIPEYDSVQIQKAAQAAAVPLDQDAMLCSRHTIQH
eukprot:3726931-Heterocapsa_arctica.AAC.1